LITTLASWRMPPRVPTTTALGAAGQTTTLASTAHLQTGKDGNLSCFNSNLDGQRSLVFSFHDPKRCAAPD